MRSTASLQRSGAGLWFSACGRFAIRRLPTRQWAVCSVGAADRIGGFTAVVSRQVASQRFSSLSEARSALDLALLMASDEVEEVEVEWDTPVRALHSVDLAGDRVELELVLQQKGRLWQVYGQPPLGNPDGEERNLLESFVMSRLRYFLGQARTRLEARQIVSQELSLPWPRIEG